MRITHIYELKNTKIAKDRIAEGLMHDILAVAEEQLGDNEFTKFAIKFKIEPVSKYT